jgi:uncharacterized protein YraI
MGASQVVAVEVQAGVTQPTPEPTSPPAEATATTPPSAEPAVTSTPETAQVTANVNANVRSGPGTNYLVVGGLAEGASAAVTGRNTDNSWWQINYEGRAAWIAGSVVTANTQAFNAPVVSAPPPPPTNTPLPPTATSPATATPGPSATPIPTSGFRVDQTNLSAGQCTTLRWDFGGIKAIFLSFGLGYDEEGQPGHGTRQVCPSVTTTFKARVVKTDGSQQIHELTVNVSGSGCGDPYITRFVPTTDEVPLDPDRDEDISKPFSVFWDVDCAKSVRYIKGDGPEQAVTGHGSSISERITGDTTFKLRVEKHSGGFVVASFVVRLK